MNEFTNFVLLFDAEISCAYYAWVYRFLRPDKNKSKGCMLYLGAYYIRSFMIHQQISIFIN